MDMRMPRSSQPEGGLDRSCVDALSNVAGGRGLSNQPIRLYDMFDA
jgi:hypothetical protein